MKSNQIVGPRATTVSLGIIQLAGDLGGTAEAPTVSGRVSISTEIVAGTGLTGGGDLSTDRTLAVTGVLASVVAGAPIEVTGSRGGNAALASLLTGLATLGLITDSTT